MFKRKTKKWSRLLFVTFSLPLERRLVFVVSVVTLFLSAPSVGQELHKWKDEKGQWHISDKPPSNLPAQPQPAPSLKHGGPSSLGGLDARVGPTKTPSQAEGGLVYDRVVCREQLSRQIYSVEAMVQNVSAHTVTVLSSASFFDSAGRLIEKKDNPAEYEERLKPGQKALVRVTIVAGFGSFREFPRLGSCELDVRPK